jgi:hypothetical protein
MGKSWKDKGRRDKWDRFDAGKNKKSKKKWDNQDNTGKRTKWDYEEYGDSY